MTDRRPSQIRAYHQIVEDGLLTRRREEVYDWLFRHGRPATANEVANGIGGRDRGATSCRLKELRDLSVVEEVGERPCTVTGMTVIEYDVTENLPVQVNNVNVRTLSVTVVFRQRSEHHFDEDALVNMFPGLIDHDVVWRVRPATDREVAIMQREDGSQD